MALLISGSGTGFACATCGKGAMPTSWDYRLVILSITIAIIGSYVSLDFAGRMNSAKGLARKLWFSGGALLMGLAIWSMHFIGMLALRMEMPVFYDEGLSALSMLAAAVGSGIAFGMMLRPTVGTFNWVTGSISMGLAIVSMHYMGMASMVMPARIQYEPKLFTLSILIAICASGGALLLAFRLRKGTSNFWFMQKILGAVVMGVAISGMHYTGMAAASYYPIIPIPSSPIQLGANTVGMVGPFKLSDILLFSGIVFGLALILLGANSAIQRERENTRQLERERLASEIVDNIRSEMDLNIILKQAVDRLGQFTEADRCTIWLYQQEQHQFLIPQHEYRRLAEFPSIFDTPFPETPVLQNLAPCKTLVLEDVLSSDELTTEDRLMIEKRRIKSFLHVPILYKEKLLGVLRIHAILQKRGWHEETISVVQGIAAQLAIAIFQAQTLQKLKAADARKSAILESSLDAIVTIDQESTVVEWNGAAESTFGYSRVKAIGKKMASLIIPDRFRKDHYQGIQHFLKTGEGLILDQRIEMPTLRRDGSEFPAELTVTQAPNIVPPMFTGTLRDITLRKEAEASLRESEERFRSLAETAPVIISITDHKGKITYANKMLLEFLGVRLEEILGSDLGERIHPEDCQARQEQLNENMGKEQDIQPKNFQTEYRIRRSNGDYRWLLGTIAPRFTGQGEFVGYIESASDITERKQTRQELERMVNERTAQLEAVNKELESFSYSVSHDLRAPLRGIDGYGQAILEDYKDKLDDKGKHYLQRMRSETQRMAQLIDDMLTLSRVTRGEIHEDNVNLSTIVKDLARELQEQDPQRNVEFKIQEGIVTEGDSRLLQAALQNLLGNAWKFTSKHPSAHIEFGVQQHQETEGKQVYFIKDDGAGFDMTYENKLFGAFQRLHGNDEFPGTGIGLATVQRIIHRHGGEIWAEGAVEQGATFYFTLN